VNKNSNNRIEGREGKGNKTGVGECRGEWKRGRGKMDKNWFDLRLWIERERGGKKTETNWERLLETDRQRAATSMA
jgi:hypothetical protein